MLCTRDKLQRAEIPSLQVAAVSIRSVPVPQPKAPEEALLVKDEREASSFIVHLVLLCRIQSTDAVSIQEEDVAECWLMSLIGTVR